MAPRRAEPSSTIAAVWWELMDNKPSLTLPE